MYNFLSVYWTDVYKTGHKDMLPVGSRLMYSNLTPRSGKHSNAPEVKGVVWIGAQKTWREIEEDWRINFFSRPESEIDQFGQDMTRMLMLDEPFDVSHIKALHRLGYLPLRVKSLPEGSFVPYKVPVMTIVNTELVSQTVADWLVNYIETILSAESWQTPTSATLGLAFRRLGNKWLQKTDPENMWLLDYQFHDFSMRGMGGRSAIINSGLGFAATSRGSDTLPVIPAARKYYDEPLDEVVINSVIASEHAIMCTLTGFYMNNGKGEWDKVGDFEYEAFVHLIKRYPKGILSLVMDTWDLWRAILDYCKRAKDLIMARDGKLVIRPDSGDPVDIMCGCFPSVVKDGEFTHETKGVVELLWDIFGGEMTSTGYKRLDSHIGCIYGDSINLQRAEAIFNRLECKGFASSNVVLGVGSYSLQFVTRDTHGFAQKATYVEVDSPDGVVGIEIFKDPITDGGVKKSAKGLLRVDKVDDTLQLTDQCTWEEEAGGELQVVFENGEFYNKTTFKQIRERVNQLV